MLTACIMGAFIIMACAPKTLVGRGLRQLFVERPPVMLSRIRPGHMLLAGGVLLAAIFAFWLLGMDGLKFVGAGISSPDIWALASMIDTATYVEALMAAVLILPLRRRGMSRDRKTPVPVRRFKARAARVRAATPLHASNDNDPNEDRCGGRWLLIS